jgi:hypothetical protein
MEIQQNWFYIGSHRGYAASGGLPPENENTMKQYVIDQLRERDFLILQDHLNSHAEAGELPGIYWVQVPETLYEGLQCEHTDCQPFYFAINLDHRSISFELLIRTRQALRCGCILYATQQQRDFIMAYADGLFQQLGLKT